MLSTMETENIKNLEKERDRLQEELKKLEASDSEVSVRREGSPFGKREEEADEWLELEKRTVMERHLRDSLSEINRALEKYKAGSYGICDRCGNSIEPARLEALPQANLCLKCKSKQSKESKNRSAR